MTIAELRKKTKMKRTEFAKYLGIPYRTVEDWEKYPDKCKDYIVRAFYYQLLFQNMITKEDEEAEQK